jgi:hypothetical protein
MSINVIIFRPLRPVVYGTGNVSSSAAYYLPSYKLCSCPPIHRATLLYLQNQLVEHVISKTDPEKSHIAQWQQTDKLNERL